MPIECYGTVVFPTSERPDDDPIDSMSSYDDPLDSIPDDYAKYSVTLHHVNAVAYLNTMKVLW